MPTHDRSSNDFEHISTVLRTYLETLNQMCARRTPSGVATGFAELDRLTGGLQKSNLILLAARPGVGSTAFALSVAHNTALRYGRAVGVFSLDMSKDQLATRFLSMDAVIDQERLQGGNVSDDEWERISESVVRLSGASIYCEHSIDCTTDEFADRAARVVEDRNLDLVIVDSLQLLCGVGSLRTTDRMAEILESTRQLKNLARELSIPIVAISQLPPTVRRSYDTVPDLEDLRRSGASDEHADVVVLVDREELYNPDTDRPNIADIIVAKNRSGPVGQFSLYFQEFCGRFRDIEKRYAS